MPSYNFGGFTGDPELEALRQRMAYAEMLRQQGGDQPQGQMVSGHYVAPSWTQQAANMLRSYMGAKAQRDAQEQYTDIMSGRRARIADALRTGDFSAVADIAPELAAENARDVRNYQQQIKRDSQQWEAQYARAQEQDERRALEREQDAAIRRQERKEDADTRAAERAQDRADKAAGIGNNIPSSLAEFDAYNKMTPEQQRTFLTIKRAERGYNLGDRIVVSDPTNPAGPPAREMKINLSPDKTPSALIASEAAKEKGKQLGEAEAALAVDVSKLPQLKATVKKLSELGKDATYTIAGRGIDEARRQLGMEPRAAAVARAEYISLVDNQILPLLSLTFGAQFTQKEGESLKVTLGDPNKSPQEKDAVLRSFIDQKLQTIESKKRQIANMRGGPAATEVGNDDGGNDDGFDEADRIVGFGK
jgi:hypothetical protein